MWNNYIKPIIKTNLLAIGYIIILFLVVLIPLTFIFGFYYGPELVNPEEIYQKLPYQIMENIVATLAGIFITIKTAEYLFRQKTDDKKKLLNIYLIFGVLSSILMSIYLDINYPYEGNWYLMSLSSVVNLLLFVVLSRNIFANNGKLNYKKII